MSGIINSAGSPSGIIGQTELDYEEGTWTPIVDLKSGFSNQATYVRQEGKYVKIGDLCTVGCEFTINQINHGLGSHISGLPFIVDNSPNAIWAAPVQFFSALIINVVFVALRAQNNTNQIYFAHTTTAAGAVVNGGVLMGNSSRFAFSMTYQVKKI